ncbi:hypothetical protein [Mesorhizobium sp. ANAO-SY3R2]|uniref:hypothetical protein n=1 Tax=Mesorhizobium sp. ANAO-SY3R2 TaxID=3166644 RepID=UPI00366BDC31
MRIALPEKRLTAFQQAVTTGETGRLAALLADDIVLAADGGGKVAAIGQPVSGKADVLAFVTESLGRWWDTYEWRTAVINGTHGALLFEGGQIAAAVSFSCDDEDRATGIYIMRNPDKLARLVDTKAQLS